MSDPARLDQATQRVFNNENALKAYKRYGLTASIAEQIASQYRLLTIESGLRPDLTADHSAVPQVSRP